MKTQIINPTRAQFVSLIDRSEEETIRGIVSTTDGTIIICDGGARIHQQLANENGVENYMSFVIEKGWDDDHDYRCDYPAAFLSLNFLKTFRVDVATIGIIPPRN